MAEAYPWQDGLWQQMAGRAQHAHAYLLQLAGGHRLTPQGRGKRSLAGMALAWGVTMAAMLGLGLLAEAPSLQWLGYWSVGGLALLAATRLGHARHHLCVWDARSRSWFTGDTFGLSYRELDGPNGPFILPTTSPVQFEPEALKASIALLLSYRPQAMYLTHYDRIGDVEKLAADLIEQIDAMVAVARHCDAATADIDERHARLRAALSDLYLRRARAQAVPLDDAGVLRTIDMDIELNAQGLACWLDRERR